MGKYDFYIASPFLKDHERKTVELIALFLRQKGFVIYVPFEHKIPNAWDYPNYEWGRMVFENDIDAINYSEYVIVVSYGRISTAGTNFEAGYAYGIKKKTILVEMCEGEIMSVMISNSSYATVKGVKGLMEYDFVSMPQTIDNITEQK